MSESMSGLSAWWKTDFTRQYASDNDGHGAGEALEDVVSVLDDNSDDQTSAGIQGH